jgi:RHS repeat-associated protein
MTTRVEGGLTYTQTFDAENRLISVTVSGQTTQFKYDGDNNLVMKIKPDGSKTIYVGGVYEVNKNASGSVTGTTTYYPAGGAMRVNGTLYYVLKDKLGSASVVTDTSGNIVGEQRYYPYGETRLVTGTMNTDKLFTGQREITGLGIYHYGSRFYSPKLGRFLSADTMVPNPFNPQALNRYSYVYGNPLRYTDPSGHTPVCGFSYSDPECSTITPRTTTTTTRTTTTTVTTAGSQGGRSGGGASGGRGGGEPDWEDLSNSGYNDWEIQILQELYNEGGQDGELGVENIIANDIHIDIGEPLTIYAPNPNGDIYSGNWQSAFSVGAWYDGVNNVVYLNPYAPGVQFGVLPSDYALANVIHESIHILQGSQASTAYGELEAWQTGFRVLDALNGIETLSETQQAIVGLPLNHDRGNLITALNLMLEDQDGQYLGAYPLYIQAIFNP